MSLVAGASLAVGALLAIGMFGFQASIGALNDLRDAEHDRLTRLDKPIPAGLVTARAAGAVVVIGAAAGLAVSAWFGLVVLALGGVGLGAGFAYDLSARRAILGPLAFAIALPTLLAWTWWAAAGTLPPGWPLLLPLAALAGPGVHLANGMADIMADRRSGATSLATRLGRRRSGLLLLVLDVAVWTLAWLGLAWVGPPSSAILLVVLLATSLAAAGAALSLARRTATSKAGWMVGAVALAMLAVAWGATVAA